MAGMAYKVLLTVSGIAAGKAAKKVTTSTWKTATGGTPPVDKHDPNYSAAQVAVFAILSSAIAGGFRAYAQRKASDYYTKTSGHLPPPVEKARKKAEAAAAAKGSKKSAKA
ncbi:DUF4235 domain-containing protein [Flexivirga oryzae]|uniref:DUF4235 domain-containing protein n=1 Tax=Flexivirga oryzae TaxID=1794944 RepID=A0A839NF01_9MICO|nr:DUF4235 domain-containing protein [Flexivirga oryzae]MBB2893271.1 hypothetical protein [Flexivirga oryzae]